MREAILSERESAYADGVAAEHQRCVTLFRSWVIEAESESGQEASGWLELAIERLGD